MLTRPKPKKLGATILEHEPILSWKATGSGVVVKTSKNTIRADRLVVTSGAWTKQILADIDLPLTVHRAPQFWFDAEDRYKKSAGTPCFGIELPSGFFYGVPTIDEFGIRVTLHAPGVQILDPGQRSEALDQEELNKVHECIDTFLPGVTKRLRKHVVCMYTMTPDEHFIIDHHPLQPNVCFAAGFSGHGFKFAAAVGEALAGLSCEGRSKLPIDFLKLRPGRFSPVKRRPIPKRKWLFFCSKHDVLQHLTEILGELIAKVIESFKRRVHHVRDELNERYAPNYRDQNIGDDHKKNGKHKPYPGTLFFEILFDFTIHAHSYLFLAVATIAPCAAPRSPLSGSVTNRMGISLNITAKRPLSLKASRNTSD